MPIKIFVPNVPPAAIMDVDMQTVAIKIFVQEIGATKKTTRVTLLQYSKLFLLLEIWLRSCVLLQSINFSDFNWIKSQDIPISGSPLKLTTPLTHSLMTSLCLMDMNTWHWNQNLMVEMLQMWRNLAFVTKNFHYHNWSTIFIQLSNFKINIGNR